MTTRNDLLAEAVRTALDRGWVRPAEIHESGLCAWDASRSHTVVLLELGERGLVLKRHRHPEDDVQGSRGRELVACRTAAGSDDLAGFAPAVIADGPGGFLVLERLPGPDLADVRRADDRHERSRSLLGRTASSLGAWHRSAPNEGDEIPRFRPWVFDAFADDRPSFLDTNAGARRFLAAAPTELGRLTERAGEAWTSAAFVHGDIRFDNVIVVDRDVVFIDWECAGLGDPAWDLAALLASVIADSGVRRLGDRLAPPVRQDLATAIEGYEAGAGITSPAFGDRIGLACGARLVQNALQVAGNTPKSGASGEAERLGSLALQFARRPRGLLETVRPPP